MKWQSLTFFILFFQILMQYHQNVLIYFCEYRTKRDRWSVSLLCLNERFKAPESREWSLRCSCTSGSVSKNFRNRTWIFGYKSVSHYSITWGRNSSNLLLLFTSLFHFVTLIWNSDNTMDIWGPCRNSLYILTAPHMAPSQLLNTYILWKYFSADWSGWLFSQCICLGKILSTLISTSSCS